MKGMVKVLDGSGHTTYPFDTETGKGVEEAVAAFRLQLDAHNSIAFDTSQKPGVQIKEFNPQEHADVTVVPAFQGG